MKVNWEQVPKVQELSEKVLQNIQKRNKFHNLYLNKWFKSRYHDKVKPQYLYYPEERQLQMELKQIFQMFANNNKESLSIAEIYLMFKHFGFQVLRSDLAIIYSFIDSNRDGALSMDEFKAFTEHPSALQSFREMMNKLSKHVTQNWHYTPLSVGAMLTYLSYMLQRERLFSVIKNEQIGIRERYTAFQSLVSNTEKKSIVEDAFELYVNVIAEYAKLKKNSVKDEQELIKIKEEEDILNKYQFRKAYRKSYSCMNGLEPLLFKNMSVKDAEQITEMAKQYARKSQILSVPDISDTSIDSQEELTKEQELQCLLEKAQEKGKKQAMQSETIIHTRNSSMEILNCKLPRLRLRQIPQKAVTNQSMLQRQFKVNRYKSEQSEYGSSKRIYEKSPQHQSTYASNEISMISNEQGTWTNRVLSLRLKQ